MYASLIIVLREVLEAALVIGIVLAGTAGTAGSRRMVAIGLGTGVLGALGVAIMADAIGQALSGMGQEAFNATVLLLAVAMLAWHQAWMQRHGADLSRNLRAVGEAVRSGSRPLVAVAVVVALAVLREGAEVVLFLHGIAAGGRGAGEMLAGALLGLGAGAAVGVLLYLGLVRVPTRHLFRVTGWLLICLAAGMAAQAAGYLVQGGWLSPLIEPVWDTSAWLPTHGFAGQVLHALVGYDDRPSAMQLLFFLAVFAGIVWLGRRVNASRPGATPAATAAMFAVMAVLLHAPRAEAGHKVYSPIVEEGEVALEFHGHRQSDGDPELDGARQFKLELEYAPAAYWLTALVGEWEKEPSGSQEATEAAWENIFQLFEQGRYAVDVGLLVEYAHSLESGGDDKLEIGALLQKDWGRHVLTANLVAERELAGGAETELEYALQYRWRRDQRFEPGLELYGEFGEFGEFGSIGDHGHALGPAAFGKLPLGQGALRYEVGWLFGLTEDAAAQTVRFLLEYEF
jgi:high-affinity iron transporter